MDENRLPKNFTRLQIFFFSTETLKRRKDVGEMQSGPTFGWRAIENSILCKEDLFSSII